MDKYFLKTYQPLYSNIPQLVRRIQFEFVGPKNIDSKLLPQMVQSDATQPTGAIVKTPLAKKYRKSWTTLLNLIKRNSKSCNVGWVVSFAPTKPKSKYQYLLAVLCIAFCYLTCANATIYKTTDANGNSHFTDAPQADAATVTLKPVNYYTAANTNNKQTNTAPAEKSNSTVYKQFVIASPKDQDTLQNTNEVTVALQLQPTLKTGDSIEFLLDGHALPSTTATNITLSELTRGEHKLQARLLNAEKKLLMTTPIVTIYVHQVSIIEAKD
jgi:hypothetical protein